MTEREALVKLAFLLKPAWDTIDIADQMAMAADGPVSRTADEISRSDMDRLLKCVWDAKHVVAEGLRAVPRGVPERSE